MDNGLTRDEKREATNILGDLLARVHAPETEGTFLLGDVIYGSPADDPDHGYEDCPSDQPGPDDCGFHPEGVAVGMGA